MQVDKIKITLKSPGTKRLQLKYNTAFKRCDLNQLAPELSALELNYDALLLYKMLLSDSFCGDSPRMAPTWWSREVTASSCTTLTPPRSSTSVGL